MQTKSTTGTASPPKTVAQVLGELTWLLTQSPLHKTMFIGDLEWFVMPAILSEQFRVFNGADGVPAAFITFATVSPETDARLEAGAHKLAPHEWQGGDILWLMEVVAPFGGVDAIMADLVQTMFPGRVFKFHMTTPDGQRRTATSSEISPPPEAKPH
jgi:cytolysin-activating lysine-acyltransferase